MPKTASPRRHGTLGPTADIAAQIVELRRHWFWEPVAFAEQALGFKPEPWQADVLEAMVDPTVKRIAVKACHGVGKTGLMAVGICFWTAERPLGKNPSTAPTYSKQVRDVLWAEVGHWWSRTRELAPWLWAEFELQTTRLQHRETREWFSVGIPSKIAVNMEGYHSPHTLVCLDEGKGIGQGAYEAVQGIMTDMDPKLLVCSTPGGRTGEFHKVFDRLRSSWNTFSIHPAVCREEVEPLRDTPLAIQPGQQGTTRQYGGAYYSDRATAEWVEDCRERWGAESSTYKARTLGLYQDIVGDELYPHAFLAQAEDLSVGIGGPTWVCCDVARWGRDRTVIMVVKGGTVLFGEAIAQTLKETTSPVVRTAGVGDDPRHPEYRRMTVLEERLVQLRIRYSADGIAVDEGNMGQGLVDRLKSRGENVKGEVFGGSPTDKPKDAAQAERLRRQGRLDSRYVNHKAEMAGHLAIHLENGNIALGLLDRVFVRNLISQMAGVKKDEDAAGRLKIIDPDQDEQWTGIADEEGKRSPDHFHALIVGIWNSCGKTAAKYAAGAALPPGVARVGVPSTGATATMSGQVKHAAAGRVGGQGRYISGFYKP